MKVGRKPEYPEKTPGDELQASIGTAERSRWPSVYSKLEPRFRCGGGESLALPVGLTARVPKTGRRVGPSSPKWPDRRT